MISYCTVEDFETRMQTDPCCQVLDVREPGEFSSERIEGCRNIPLGGLKTRSWSDFDKTNPLLLVCHDAPPCARWLDCARAIEIAIVQSDSSLQVYRGKAGVSTERARLPMGPGAAGRRGRAISRTHVATWAPEGTSAKLGARGRRPSCVRWASDAPCLEPSRLRHTLLRRCSVVERVKEVV